MQFLKDTLGGSQGWQRDGKLKVIHRNLSEIGKKIATSVGARDSRPGLR